MGEKFLRNRSISYGFRDIHTFSFSAKIQDGHQKWRKLKFSPLDRTLVYYPAGQTIARNRSISYGFRDIHTFSFSAKIQDDRQKWRKLIIFPFCIGHSCTTLWVKNSLEIALSRTVFEIFTLFLFLQKSKMATKIQAGCQKWRKLNFFPLYIGHSCTTLGVKNSLEIALSLTFFEIFVIFHIFTNSSNEVAITHLYTEQHL